MEREYIEITCCYQVYNTSARTNVVNLEDELRNEYLIKRMEFNNTYTPSTILYIGVYYEH